MIRTLTPVLLGSLLCASGLAAQSGGQVEEIKETVRKALEQLGQDHKVHQSHKADSKSDSKSHNKVIDLGDIRATVVRVQGKDGKLHDVTVGGHGKGNGRAQGKVKVLELGDGGHVVELKDIELEELGKKLQEKIEKIIVQGKGDGHHVVKIGDGGHAIFEVKGLDGDIKAKLEKALGGIEIHGAKAHDVKIGDLKIGDHDIRIVREPQDKKSVSVTKSMRISIGDEGVRVELDENGKKKEYSADSMEGLLRKHPELRAKISGWSAKRRGAEPKRVRVQKKEVEEQRGRDEDDEDDEENEALEALNKQIEALRARMERLRKELDRELGGVSKKAGATPRSIRLAPVQRAKKSDEVEEEEIVEEHEEHESEGPKLGVSIREFSNEIRSFLGLPDGVGLMVDEVMDGSTAAKVGLQSGDLIVKINGKWIKKPADVADALRASKKGTTVDYYRKGAKLRGGSK